MKIECENELPEKFFERLARSFMFNIAYNMDIVVRPIFSLGTDARTYSGIKFCRTKNIYELESPFYDYDDKLLDQYYMALVSTDPVSAYISFYHIFEYFYIDIYKRELMKNITDIIRDPEFSSKRKSDIEKLVNLTWNEYKKDQKGFQGGEAKALELLLYGCVDFESVRDKLKKYNESLVNYYASHKLSFCDGAKISLYGNLGDDSRKKRLSRKLASRIFDVRNAVVHHKSDGRNGVKDRGYRPFECERELIDELPMMRILAEEIILQSSVPL